MKILGLIASAIFLTAMVAAKPNPPYSTMQFIWGSRLFFSLACAAFLWAVLKPAPARNDDERRRAVTPLTYGDCLYCKGPLQTEPEVHCSKCGIRFWGENPVRYDLEAIVALPPAKAMSILRQELYKMDRWEGAPGVVMLVKSADFSIGCDGFEEWFSDGNPEEVRELLTALAAIGASHRLEVLRRALAIFPNSQPPDSGDAYDQIVSGLTTEQASMLDQLGDEFYYNDENLDELSYRYVIANLEEFRRK